MNYRYKYEKYKHKYLQLKNKNNQMGGVVETKSNKQLVGNFMIESGEIVAKDPGYDIMEGSIFSDIIIPVQNGTWDGYIKYFSDEKKDNPRISELMIYNQNFKDKINDPWIQLTDVDVDTGQAGFFDLKHFRNDQDVNETHKMPTYIELNDEHGQKWYAMCCQMTYDEKTKESKAGVVPFGIVSSSGYGDGSYNVCGIKNDNKFIALKMSFE